MSLNIDSYTEKTTQNGLSVLLKKTTAQSVVLMLTINAGSNHEVEHKGIAHFLEHMVFEGTKKYKDAYTISQRIEAVGGEINAATSKNKTYIFVKVLAVHIHLALEFLSDVASNCTFKPEFIRKEKSVVTHEIMLNQEDPRSFQWTLFERTLFDRHQAKYDICGTKSSVASITREDILSFYNTYYTTKHAVLSVVGSYPTTIMKLIDSYFSTFPKGKAKKHMFIEEKNTKQKIVTKKFANLTQTYVIIGWHAPQITQKEAYVLDVIETILSKGQSGWLFDTFRNKQALAYDVRASYESEKTGSFFAINIITIPKMRTHCKELLFSLLEKLKTVDEQTVIDAKVFLESKYLIGLEDSLVLAQTIAENKLDEVSSYLANVKKVTVSDVQKLAASLFTENYTETALVPK